jgi:two-component system, NarL family, nitrate/nitrite response regulator NarL
MPIRLVIVDDHPIVLESLRALFERDPEMDVVAACADGEAALALVATRQPDVTVLDFRMPGLDGLAVIRALRQSGTHTRVVLLSGEFGEDDMAEAVRLGVDGVVLKEMAPSLLVQCVREVHAGRKWLEKRLLGQVVEQMLRRDDAWHELARRLSPRELDVVRAAASGLRAREIAERLHIAEGTAKLHLHAIYAKLGVRGREALLRNLRDRAIV